MTNEDIWMNLNNEEDAEKEKFEEAELYIDSKVLDETTLYGPGPKGEYNDW